MTKTRPHFTRCIEHFFPRRGGEERRKVSLSNSASFLWSHLSCGWTKKRSYTRFAKISPASSSSLQNKLSKTATKSLLFQTFIGSKWTQEYSEKQLLLSRLLFKRYTRTFVAFRIRGQYYWVVGPIIWAKPFRQPGPLANFSDYDNERWSKGL